MRLEQLEYLIEIAKQNSMSTASEQLHLAPQTLSISMKNLEKEMGFPIFERTSKGATLTENGKLVLQFALKTVTEYHNIIAQCTPQTAPSIQQDFQGALTIYSNPIFFYNTAALLYTNVSQPISQCKTLYIIWNYASNLRSCSSNCSKPARGCHFRNNSAALFSKFLDYRLYSTQP